MRQILDGRIDMVIQALASQKEYADARFEATQRETALSLTTQKEAVQKQERASERTVTALQEALRAELFVVKEGIDTNSGRLDRSEGQRLGATQLWTLILGLVTLLILMGGFFATVMQPDPIPVPVPMPEANSALHSEAATARPSSQHTPPSTPRQARSVTQSTRRMGSTSYSVVRDLVISSRSLSKASWSRMRLCPRGPSTAAFRIALSQRTAHLSNRAVTDVLLLGFLLAQVDQDGHCQGGEPLDDGVKVGRPAPDQEAQQAPGEPPQPVLDVVGVPAPPAPHCWSPLCLKLTLGTMASGLNVTR